MDNGIGLKELAEELGKPYAVVLKAAHVVGVELERGKRCMITSAIRKKIEAELKIKPAKAKAKA